MTIRDSNWFTARFGHITMDNIYDNLKDKIIYNPPTATKKNFSITSDILSFKRCKRQYGFYQVRKFVAAGAPQLFFGKVIHSTLDRIHSYFRGDEDITTRGIIPKDDLVEDFFYEQVAILRNQGVYIMGKKACDAALEYIMHFNNQYGSDIYPRIIDTEYRLQTNNGDFMITGIVDVLAKSHVEAIEIEEPIYSEYEIWDYKGGKRPKKDCYEMKNYLYQMQVYSYLYRQRTQTYPKKAIIWFMAEKNESQAKLEVEIKPEMVDNAIIDFTNTVKKIEQCTLENDWLPPKIPPTKDTCSACDFRHSCANWKTHSL